MRRVGCNWRTLIAQKAGLRAQWAPLATKKALPQPLETLLGPKEALFGPYWAHSWPQKALISAHQAQPDPK